MEVKVCTDYSHTFTCMVITSRNELEVVYCLIFSLGTHTHTHTHTHTRTHAHAHTHTRTHTHTHTHTHAHKHTHTVLSIYRES